MSGDRDGGRGEESGGPEGRAASRLIYPVRSRRSGGLSIGINLFPSGKACTFDCPYCEVFSPSVDVPGASGAGPIRDSADPISIDRLEAELADFLDREWAADWAPEAIRDLCFSGDGEPTLSPSLERAVAACDRARRARPALLGGAKLVLITNSTGFLDPATSSALGRAVDEHGLEIWAKLDAGDEELFGLMSGSALSLSRVAEGIEAFARARPIAIQTMLCELPGRLPSNEDARRIGGLLASLASRGARLSRVQVYTFARPTPGGGCAALSDARLSELAAEIGARSGLPVGAYGERGELPPVPEGRSRKPEAPADPGPEGTGR